MQWWRDAGVDDFALPQQSSHQSPHRAAPAAPGMTHRQPAPTHRPDTASKRRNRPSPDHAQPPTNQQRPSTAPPQSPRNADPAHALRNDPARVKTQELIQTATDLAQRAATLDELHRAIAGFDRHPLHAVARTTVFARGHHTAPIMVIGEAPGRDEDRVGQPFVGPAGQLLDAMFASIGHAADPSDAQQGLYLTNVVNWRPPGNRSPSVEEIQIGLPLIARHIALVRPKILVFAGGIAAQAMLKTTNGITRLRGTWASFTSEGEGKGDPIPAMPIYHPAFVLRRPIAKRDVWRDLLAIEAKLNTMG